MPELPPIDEQFASAMKVYRDLVIRLDQATTDLEDAQEETKRRLDLATQVEKGRSDRIVQTIRDLSKQQTLLDSLWKGVTMNAPKGSLWNSGIRDSSL